MAVLRVAHVWGDRLLDVRHLAGSGALGPLQLTHDRILIDGAEIRVGAREQVDVPFGATALRLTWVDAAPRASAVAEDADWNFAKLVACLLLTSAAVVAMFTIQVELGFTQDDGVSRVPVSYRKIFAEPPPKKIKVEPTAVAKADVPKDAAPTKSAQRKTDKPLEAKKVGLLGALEFFKDAQNLFEPGGISPGVQNALDNLKGGPNVADARGLNMGPRGFGPGNGNGLGIDGPGFTKRPSGGGPAGNLIKKIETGPCCEATKVSDGLAKDVIARVIRLKFSEIKFCYEKSLQQSPDLAGKLVVLFVIDATGTVSEANVAEATIEDPALETCVLNRVRRWKFPEPRGGGVVSVTHPWFFKPAGSED